MKDNPLIHRPTTAPDYPRWTESLRDRQQVLIRPITKLDLQAEREFIESLSALSRRYRFLGQIRTPSEKMLERFTDIDYVHEVAFVATVMHDGRERIVGVSRYCTDEPGESCECAVTVSDEWQDKGLGTLLMKHLIEVARARGIRTMSSIDSAENMKMKDLAKHLGFHARVDPDNASQVIHELEL